MSLFRRLLNLGRAERLSRDIERETQFHLDALAAEFRAQGMSPGDAALAARRQFGNPTFQREETRDADVVTWMDSLARDVRYGLRALRHSPAFTTVAVVSLALGIGANTAIYSLIDAVVLRPLPVPHPEELVMVSSGTEDGGGAYFTNPLWEAIRDRDSGLRAIAAFGDNTFFLGTGPDAREIPTAYVSGDFFRVFDTQPALGRLFTAADDVRGCPGITALSWDFWQTEFDGRRDAIGRTIQMQGKPFLVVGVAERGFTGPEVGSTVKAYVPICAEAYVRGAEHSALDRRSNWWLRVIGRRDPAMSAAQATARLKTIAPAAYAATVPPNWGKESQQEYHTRTLNAYPAERGFSAVRTRYAKALLIMMGAVALVLLIACANVANLLLARAAARSREIAIRLAVGAGRSRLVRQLVTESALLAVAGAALGLIVAQWGTRALVALISTPDSQLVLDTSINAQVLLFTAVAAAVTTTVFGLVPAWRGTRVSPQAAMKAGGRGVAEGGGAHARFTLSKSLVAAQVALSLTLLVGSALLIGSLRNLASVDPGFRAQGVLVATANFERSGLTDAQMAPMRQLLLDRVRALPGVRAAATSELTPIGSSSWNNEVVVDGYTPKSFEDALAWYNQVSDGYFRTMDTRLLSGRDFDQTDRIGGPKVAIVNEALAQKFFGTPAAVGRTFREKFGDSLSAPYTIIGVVADSKYRALREDNSETIYLPASQSTSGGYVVMEVRGDGDPLQLVSAIKQAIAQLQPAATARFVTLDAQVARSLQRERLLAVLSGLFGALALLLATLGLYGVMTYTVARRRNEIGVRIALGADRARVLGMVLGDVARVVLAGLVIGAAGAMASGRLVASFLYGLTAADPVILGSAAAVLAGVALCAGLAPALRASRVDPVTALRED